MHPIDRYIDQDLRIGSVEKFARSVYEGGGLPLHSFRRAFRTAERAIGIMEEIQEGKYTILIPAALLSGIGAALTGSRDGHQGRAALVVRHSLPQFGYDSETVDGIATAVAENGAVEPSGIESAILSDADILDLAGIPGIDRFPMAAKEYKLSPAHTAVRMMRHLQERIDRGLHTGAARALDARLGANGMSGMGLALQYATRLYYHLTNGSGADGRADGYARRDLGLTR
ncbi:hypothetical protein JXB02_04225 [Candidatus Woesearchaeota archaeon]|nr:hypothetical protein [Candidatus Woesearchaeota archaeon]